jgi:leader peptidase (prepilin peptidase) / N-methyltransferase
VTWQIHSLTEHFPITRSEIGLCTALACLCGGAAAYGVSPTFGFFSAYLVAAMLLITVIDSRCMMIPDALSLPAIPVGLLGARMVFDTPLAEIAVDNLLAAALAGGTLYAIRAFYYRMRGIEGLGLGDVKLAMVAGSWLGLAALPTVCLLATSAALAAVIIKARFGSQSSTPTMTTAIPFGSFIAPAIVLIWFYSIAIN